MSLKELTSEKHKIAEQCKFNVRMMRGDITIVEYVMYLSQLYEIFKVLEETPLPHPSLNRLLNISDDINELSSRHDTNIVLESTKDYVAYLQTLPQEEKLPHVYLNYMALLFGGQMMKKSLPGSGKIYNFDNTDEIIKSIRSIQSDGWVDEVNSGFDYNIRIFNELQHVSEQDSEPF